MTYAQARWLGVRSLVEPRLRRFGLGLLFVFGLASALAGDLRTLLLVPPALAAWSVLPLVDAPAVAVPVLLAVLALWQALWCPWLLPARWLELERQWPVPSAERRRSDRGLVLLVQSPWLLMQGLGLLSLGLPPLATGLAILVHGLTMAAGMVALRARRMPPRSGRATPDTHAPAHGQVVARFAPWRTVLIVPLVRGRWPRSRSHLLSGTTGLVALAAALPWIVRPAIAMILWVLASAALLPRLAALLREESAPHWSEIATLPLHGGRWALALQAVALLPLVISLATWALAPVGWRSGALVAFLVTWAVAAASWAWWPLPSDRSAWLRGISFTVLLLVLGLESLA